MAHKTLIGGTSYEIKGGKTLINGTAYEIKGGKTLVNGTGYSVKLTKEFITIYDLGSMSTRNSSFGGCTDSFSTSRLNLDFDKITHISVNGQIFKTKYSHKEDGTYIREEYGYNCDSSTENAPNANNEYYVLFTHYQTGDNLCIVEFGSYTVGNFNVKVGYLD